MSETAWKCLRVSRQKPKKKHEFSNSASVPNPFPPGNEITRKGGQNTVCV